jgi:tRNA(fMet)-specific endonuclease VapC
VIRHGQGLLDTSTIIAFDRIKDPTQLPRQPMVSAVTLAELSVGPLVATDDERVTRQLHLQRTEADFDALPFDADAARAFGQVAVSLRRAGRKVSARTYDAMIAAIAISNGLPLYTCNPRGFQGIDGLQVIAVELPR